MSTRIVPAADVSRDVTNSRGRVHPAVDSGPTQVAIRPMRVHYSSEISLRPLVHTACTRNFSDVYLTSRQAMRRLSTRMGGVLRYSLASAAALLLVEPPLFVRALCCGRAPLVPGAGRRQLVHPLRLRQRQPVMFLNAPVDLCADAHGRRRLLSRVFTQRTWHIHAQCSL